MSKTISNGALVCPCHTIVRRHTAYEVYLAIAYIIATRTIVANSKDITIRSGCDSGDAVGMTVSGSIEQCTLLVGGVRGSENAIVVCATIVGITTIGHRTYFISSTSGKIESLPLNTAKDASLTCLTVNGECQFSHTRTALPNLVYFHIQSQWVIDISQLNNPVTTLVASTRSVKFEISISTTIHIDTPFRVIVFLGRYESVTKVLALEFPSSCEVTFDSCQATITISISCHLECLRITCSLVVEHK